MGLLPSVPAGQERTYLHGCVLFGPLCKERKAHRHRHWQALALAQIGTVNSSQLLPTKQNTKQNITGSSNHHQENISTSD